MDQRALPFLAAVAMVVLGAVMLRAIQTASPGLGQAERAAARRCMEAVQAYRQHESYIWITAAGRVARILPDERGGATHQRFVLECSSGLTLLVDNNIDVGRRVPLVLGRNVVVRGQYIWNVQGGLLHYTHHGGPAGGGWILSGGHLYAMRNARGPGIAST